MERNYFILSPLSLRGCEEKSIKVYYCHNEQERTELETSCKSQEVIYYALEMVVYDVSEKEMKKEALENLSYAFTKYCEVYDNSVIDFVDVVKYILEMGVKYITITFIHHELENEAHDEEQDHSGNVLVTDSIIRHKERNYKSALRLVDSWEAMQKKKSNIHWQISDEAKRKISEKLYDKNVPNKTDKFRNALDVIMKLNIGLPKTHKEFIDVFPDSICRQDYGKILAQRGLTNIP